MTPAGGELAPGSLLAGRYALRELLDSGGAGQVWLAGDRHLDDEPVCCKVLLPEWARHPSAISDMKREVIVTRRLRHPHIRQVYTFWEDGGRYFITMEYIEGHTLAQALKERQRPFQPRQVAEWGRQLASALDYAHEHGVLHRDVKPGNVLLGPRAEVSLADFGIASALDEFTRDAAGQTSGTPRYMSPEQIRGVGIEAGSDQYSLASTLYELLAGHPPFYEGSVVSQIQLTPAPPLRGYGPALEAVFERALRKTPGSRFDSCMAFAEALAATAPEWPEEPPTMEGAWANPATEEVETVVLPQPEGLAARSRLGALLLEAGLLTEDELHRALQAQLEEPRKRLGELLVELDLATERQIARTLGRQLKLEFVEGDRLRPDPALSIPERGQLLENGCLPLRLDKDALLVAMTDPLRLDLVNTLEAAFRVPVRIVVCTEEALRAASD